MSPTSFSRLLGFDEKTISRYEAGAIPNESASNLILLVEDRKNFLKMYHHNKNRLSFSERMRFEVRLAKEEKIEDKFVDKEVYGQLD